MPKCTKCEGKTFYRSAGRLWNCRYCDEGEFPEVVATELYPLVKGQKRALRSNRPKRAPEKADAKTRILHQRAYYVWRWARFHGGIDTTFPMQAEWEVYGDPCVNDLQTIADWFAKASFGSDTAGAVKWGKALGF